MGRYGEVPYGTVIVVSTLYEGFKVTAGLETAKS